MINKHLFSTFIIFCIFALIFPIATLGYSSESDDFKQDDIKLLSKGNSKELLNETQRYLSSRVTQNFEELYTGKEQAAIAVVRELIKLDVGRYKLTKLSKVMAEIFLGQLANSLSILGIEEIATIQKLISGAKNSKEAINLLVDWLQKKEIEIGVGTLEGSLSPYDPNNKKRISYTIYYTLAYHAQDGKLTVIFDQKEFSEVPSAKSGIFWGGPDLGEDFELRPFRIKSSLVVNRKKLGFFGLIMRLFWGPSYSYILCGSSECIIKESTVVEFDPSFDSPLKISPTTKDTSPKLPETLSEKSSSGESSSLWQKTKNVFSGLAESVKNIFTKSGPQTASVYQTLSSKQETAEEVLPAEEEIDREIPKNIPVGLWEFAKQADEAISNKNINFFVENTFFNSGTVEVSGDFEYRDLTLNQYKDEYQKIFNNVRSDEEDELGDGKFQLHGISMKDFVGDTVLVATYLVKYGENLHRHIVLFYLKQQKGKWKIKTLQKSLPRVAIVYESCVSALGRACESDGEFIKKALVTLPDYIKWPDFLGQKNIQTKIEESKKESEFSKGGTKQEEIFDNIEEEKKTENKSTKEEELKEGKGEKKTKTEETSQIRSPAITSAVTSIPSGKIAFVSDRDGNNEIYLMDTDGSNQTNITNSVADDWAPTWSHDSKKIAFTSNRDGDNEIYVMNSDGSNVIQLTNNSNEDDRPKWSPDAKRIIFYSNRDGDDEIYIMDADGKNQRNLTNHQGFDGYPCCWSPDGQKIIFTSERGKYPDSMFKLLYTMNVDSDQASRLLPSLGIGGAETLVGTDWSPDGKYIAYTTHGLGYQEMHLFNIESQSGAGRLISSFLGSNITGSFSSDSEWLSFVSKRDRNWEIYLFNLVSEEIKGLTKNEADDDSPAWSPR